VPVVAVVRVSTLIPDDTPLGGANQPAIAAGVFRDNARMGPDERAIVAWLRGPAAALTPDAIMAARRHGVHLLIADVLAMASPDSDWGEPFRRELRTCAVLHTRREAVLETTLDRLQSQGVDVLLLKGAGLAYIAYDAPHLRPRLDADLLIRREALGLAHTVLTGEGWVRGAESDAELASTQRHYSKTVDGGREEHIDLHWRVANPPAFARVLSFDELRARAIPVEALGGAARTLSIADALFLACIHLVAHHADDVRLIWLVDIERLARMLTAEDRRRFQTLATRESMCGVCRYALLESDRWLETGAAAALAAELPADTDWEPSAKWLRGGSRAARLRSELAALGTWRERATLLHEHLFPSAAYLRTKYPRCPEPLLPIAALHRIVAGAPAWLRSIARHTR
jgi:hypothetical protein